MEAAERCVLTRRSALLQMVWVLLCVLPLSCGFRVNVLTRRSALLQRMRIVALRSCAVLRVSRQRSCAALCLRGKGWMCWFAFYTCAVLICFSVLIGAVAFSYGGIPIAGRGSAPCFRRTPAAPAACRLLCRRICLSARCAATGAAPPPARTLSAPAGRSYT